MVKSFHNGIRGDGYIVCGIGERTGEGYAVFIWVFLRFKWVVSLLNVSGWPCAEVRSPKCRHDFMYIK